MKKPLAIVIQHPDLYAIDQRREVEAKDWKARHAEFKKQMAEAKERIWREIYDFCVTNKLLPEGTQFEKAALEMQDGVLYLVDDDCENHNPINILKAFLNGK